MLNIDYPMLNVEVKCTNSRDLYLLEAYSLRLTACGLQQLTRLPLMKNQQNKLNNYKNQNRKWHLN